MNVNSNGDLYNSSMNDCYQNRNGRLSGGVRESSVRNLGRFVGLPLEPIEAVERFNVIFRPMNEKSSNEFGESPVRRAFQKVETNVDETKIKPYRYKKCTVNEKSRHMRTCTDIAMASPPTVQPKSLSIIKNHTEKTFYRHLIEVGADLIPMSGVDETTHAHRKGRTIDTACTECNSVLFIMQSASMVICPACRCISPVESNSNKKILPASIIHVGIGLPIDFVLGLE